VKRSIALLATFLLLFIVTATLGIAQANSNTLLAPETTTTPSTTPTATETPTTTATPTLTLTPTPDPCAVEPPAPILLAPADKAVINKTQVTLQWSKVDCATKYRFTVRRGSKNGPSVFYGKTKKVRLTTPTLTRGYWYYWLIKACRPGYGCTRSAIWSFRIPPPPTAVPSPTGQATAPPNGTPVPGNPPSNLVNYYDANRGGTGVYLNNDPSALYRYECTKDQNLWGQYKIGQTVYNIALWYYPNEKITHKRLDFNTTQIVETKTLTANGEGYVDYSVNTAAWTPDHHYHLIFEGQSSDVTYCGHFDIQSAASASELQALPHTDADVEKVYHAAGLSAPQ